MHQMIFASLGGISVGDPEDAISVGDPEDAMRESGEEDYSLEQHKGVKNECSTRLGQDMRGLTSSNTKKNLDLNA